MSSKKSSTKAPAKKAPTTKAPAAAPEAPADPHGSHAERDARENAVLAAVAEPRTIRVPVAKLFPTLWDVRGGRETPDVARVRAGLVATYRAEKDGTAGTRRVPPITIRRSRPDDTLGTSGESCFVVLDGRTRLEAMAEAGIAECDARIVDSPTFADDVYHAAENVRRSTDSKDWIFAVLVATSAGLNADTLSAVLSTGEDEASKAWHRQAFAFATHANAWIASLGAESEAGAAKLSAAIRAHQAMDCFAAVQISRERGISLPEAIPLAKQARKAAKRAPAPARGGEGGGGGEGGEGGEGKAPKRVGRPRSAPPWFAAQFAQFAADIAKHAFPRNPRHVAAGLYGKDGKPLTDAQISDFALRSVRHFARAYCYATPAEIGETETAPPTGASRS